MNADAESLRREGLAFFGRMTAGQSHEVTNVLNIVNELAGLQLDLLAAAAAGRSADLPRLAGIAERIQNQVDRGQTIIRNVNRFAHTVDLPSAVFALGEVLASVVFLSQRTAVLGRVDLALCPPAEKITIESNPFCIQQAVFVCIDLAVASASENRRLEVSYRGDGDRVRIEIESADPVVVDAKGAERLSFLRSLMTELGGTVADAPDRGHDRRFTLVIPCGPEHRLPNGSDGGPDES